MYTIGGTFREAVAFLFGYHSAHRASEAELVDMSAFSAWLSQKTGYAQSEFWWSQMSRAYPDDAEAFRQLPILFIEFMAVNNKAGKAHKNSH